MAINGNFYNKQYVANSTDIATGISFEDLKSVTDTFIQYIDGRVESLDIVVPVNNELREVFDTREKLHMVDVKKLFDLLKTLMYVTFSLVVILIASIIIVGKKEFISKLCKIYCTTSIFLFLGIVSMVCLIYVNFDLFWTQFHMLFFTNDLWMLDPSVSIMINMFPLEFFYDCCAFIIALFLGVSILIYTICIIYRKYNRNKHDPAHLSIKKLMKVESKNK